MADGIDPDKAKQILKEERERNEKDAKEEIKRIVKDRKGKK